MGLKEAKDYIQHLHKLQDDPYKWPDYLTGLPDRAAVLRKLGDVYERPSKFSVSFVRISNVHSYMLKYGSSRHAEIIQWAAAILKTTASGFKGGFVGTVGTHEFVVIARLEHIDELLKKARQLFLKRTRNFYSEKDLKNNYIMNFARDGKKVFIGFIDLVSSTIKNLEDMERSEVIPYLSRICSEMEEQVA